MWKRKCIVKGSERAKVLDPPCKGMKRDDGQMGSDLGIRKGYRIEGSSTRKNSFRVNNSHHEHLGFC